MVRDVLERSRDRLRGHRVVLFGSRARGDAGPRSDFDLGVDGDTALPLRDFYALSDALEELPTLYRFDWLDLARAGKAVRESALREGKVLYET
jgi:predicted nucleotidyltransferase